MLYQMLYRPIYEEAQASNFAFSRSLGHREVACYPDLLRAVVRSIFDALSHELGWTLDVAECDGFPKELCA